MTSTPTVTSPQEIVLDGPLDSPRVVDGIKLLPGEGAVPAKVMFVVGNPTGAECIANATFTSKECMLLRQKAKQAGISEDQCYWTYAVKYATFGNKPAKMADISKCRNILEEEINRVNPDIIVPAGTPAFMATMGPGYKITAYQHTFVQSERFAGRTLYPIPGAGYIRRNPQLEYQYNRGFEDIKNRLAGTITDSEVPFELICSTEEFASLLLQLSESMPDCIALDCEWEGERSADPGAYIRTMQLNIGTGRNYVV